MIKRVVIALFSPGTWLLSAALCLLGWAAVGYHIDQVSAAAVLGQSSGPADLTALSLARQSLFGTAMLMILAAGLLALPIWPHKHRDKEEDRPEAPGDAAATGAFQPIRTQEELGKDEVAAQPPKRNTLSRLASSVLLGRRTSKNQP